MASSLQGSSSQQPVSFKGPDLLAEVKEKLAQKRNTPVIGYVPIDERIKQTKQQIPAIPSQPAFLVSLKKKVSEDANTKQTKAPAKETHVQPKVQSQSSQPAPLIQPKPLEISTKKTEAVSKPSHPLTTRNVSPVKTRALPAVPVKKISPTVSLPRNQSAGIPQKLVQTDSSQKVRSRDAAVAKFMDIVKKLAVTEKKVKLKNEITQFNPKKSLKHLDPKDIREMSPIDSYLNIIREETFSVESSQKATQTKKIDQPSSIPVPLSIPVPPPLPNKKESQVAQKQEDLKANASEQKTKRKSVKFEDEDLTQQLMNMRKAFQGEEKDVDKSEFALPDPDNEVPVVSESIEAINKLATESSRGNLLASIRAGKDLRHVVTVERMPDLARNDLHLSMLGSMSDLIKSGSFSILKG